MKRLLPVLLILTLLLCSCGSNNTGASGSEPTNSSTNSATESTTETTEASSFVTKSRDSEIFIGELVETDGFMMCVNSVTEGDGEGFFVPEDGNKFVTIDMTLHNITNESIYNSTMSLTVLDSSGNVYETSWIAPVKGTLDGTILPGRMLRGEVAYELPKDAVATDLLFDFDIAGINQVVFKLDTEKAVEAQTYVNPVKFNDFIKLGDTITTDNFTFVIKSMQESSGNESMSPSEGNTYYIVDFTVNNTSSEVQMVDSFFLYELQDEHGYAFDPELYTELIEDIELDLDPGASVTGQAIFEVPADSTKFVLMISPHLYDNGQYVVEMQ